MNNLVVADKRGNIITLSFGVHSCPKSLERNAVWRVRIEIISWILSPFYTYSTTSSRIRVNEILDLATSSRIRDNEILDLTERSCCQVKITEQIE